MIMMVVLTALTLVSSETALVKPENPHYNFTIGFYASVKW